MISNFFTDLEPFAAISVKMVLQKCESGNDHETPQAYRSAAVAGSSGAAGRLRRGRRERPTLRSL